LPKDSRKVYRRLNWSEVKKLHTFIEHKNIQLKCIGLPNQCFKVKVCHWRLSRLTVNVFKKDEVKNFSQVSV